MADEPLRRPPPLRAEALLAALAIAPDEAGLALSGNWVLRTDLGRLDVMQDVPGMRDYDSLRARAVEREVPGAGVFASRASTI